MRVDRVYRVQHQSQISIFHFEFQADKDDDMAHRLLVYHANLWRDYKLPVISRILYLFRTPTVTSPLLERDGNGETVLIFHFYVHKLWEYDAHKFMKERPIQMYPWLPAMENADSGLLSRAIDDMVEYYQGKEATLTRQILWFSLFFRRADLLPLQEKQKVEERLKVFEQLLEQDEWVRRQKALSEQKGEQIGIAKGERALQETLVTIVQMRYPALVELARQKATSSIRGLDALRLAIEQIVAAPDEATVRFLLNTLGN